MIGIIGAMEEEVDALKNLMSIRSKDTINGYVYYTGTMNDEDVVLVQGGIGKVNATISTTLLLTKYDIDFVINIGSAGGLKSNQEVGDVVISDRVVHYDVDVTAFGREFGQVPGLPTYYEADTQLLTRVQEVLKSINIRSHVGLIASGDQFVSRDDQVQNILNHFREAMCSEMEAASVAQVCHVFNKKFIITRSLSDVYNKGDSAIQFDEYLKKASKNSAFMCLEVVKSIKQ